MNRLEEYVVAVAVALLPQRLRERYREQWLGEVRDAPSLGLRASEIALGSLAFALTTARPLPARTRPSAEALTRRAHLAVALAVSGAVLAFSQLLTSQVNAQTGPDLLASIVGATWLLLTLYAALAPLGAIVMVFATRGMSWRVRGAVLGPAVLCVLPLAGGAAIDWIATSPLGRPALAVGTTAVPALAALAAMLFERRRASRGRGEASAPREAIAIRIRRTSLWAAAVAIVTGAGFVGATSLWAARAPLVFRAPVTDASRAAFNEWLALKVQVEQTVSVTLTLWLVAGLLLAFVVAISGLSSRAPTRRTTLLGIGALSAVLLSFSALVTYLQLVLPSIAASLPLDLATEVGQIVLTAIVLAVVGTARGPHPAAAEPSSPSTVAIAP